ncbi:hypothetical protein HPB51_008049 [Rhipicephalus microplus]|uniref:Fatty acid desaturase n=1 Tax=Rhipicephalus microplus TaxID=6941 RepID=A0A9J6EFU6_RHIMP|nr:hypothetical protein HPB51_008049 [Rhipicephalus microplus]
MAPRTETATIVATEARSKVDLEPATTNDEQITEQLPSKQPPMEIIWMNVFKILVIHVMALYGLYVALFHAKWMTLHFTIFYIVCSGLSVTAGAHRLWSHRSYKAKLPLRVILMLFNCMAGQVRKTEQFLMLCDKSYARGHRVRYRCFTAKPSRNNAERKVFVAETGRGRKTAFVSCINDARQIAGRSAVREYHIPMTILFCFIVPTVLPHRLWGESRWNAFFVAAILRWVFQLNSTWLVNSAAHMWGQKPYDKNISPAENFIVSFLAIGEGFHNYHHTFPWDYSTSELGWKLNISTMFIDLMAKIGWAYDLRKPTREMIDQRVARTGDGSHPSQRHNHEHDY